MEHSYKYFVLLAAVLQVAYGTILYDDEFEGTSLNTDKWFIEVVQTSHNNELQYYTDSTDNIYLEDGHLVIKPIKENYGGKQYTSGRIHSNFAWQYGRVEVRAKLPNGFGLWPAIWMMPRDSVYGGWPQSGEIDICEARGQNLDEIASTIHYGGPCCDTHYWESSGDLKTGCSIDQYHLYQLDWTPTELVYSLDGVPYYTQDLDRVIGWMYDEPGVPFDQYFYLILNVAVGGDYLENPKPNTVWNYPDAEMWVDYVRVYPLQDTATMRCAVKSSALYDDVCDNVNWACYQQNYADVTAECTSELIGCCSNYNCEELTLKELATGVFDSYDTQVNSDTSCDFGGTAEHKYVLNDYGYAPLPQCLIKDSASNSDICGSMQWACSDDNTYADVSAECSKGQSSLNCCAVGAWTCDSSTLRQEAGDVFQAYYEAIPSASSCDFGGVCYLTGVQQPLPCSDGYGESAFP